jgi:hypothetical protein
MTKIIRLSVVLALAHLSSGGVVEVRKETIYWQPQVWTEEERELFEVPQECEELAENIPLARAKKMKISLKDVPFYTQVLCSYVYEEKLKKWYQAVAGYLGTNVGKKLSKNKKSLRFLSRPVFNGQSSPLRVGAPGSLLFLRMTKGQCR